MNTTGITAVNNFASLILDAQGGSVLYTKEEKVRVNMAIKLLCTTCDGTRKQYDLHKSLNANIINVINGGVKAHTPVKLGQALSQLNKNNDNIHFVTTESRP